MTPLANLQCPICGLPNECAPAKSGSLATPCWCAAVTIDPAVIASLPDEQRDRACLCLRCAARDSAKAGEAQP